MTARPFWHRVVFSFDSLRGSIVAILSFSLLHVAKFERVQREFYGPGFVATLLAAIGVAIVLPVTIASTSDMYFEWLAVKGTPTKILQLSKYTLRCLAICILACLFGKAMYEISLPLDGQAQERLQLMTRVCKSIYLGFTYYSFEQVYQLLIELTNYASRKTKFMAMSVAQRNNLINAARKRSIESRALERSGREALGKDKKA